VSRHQALWQYRYWEHLLRDEEDLIRHVEYVHYNPVKHGLVKHAIEWPYSSLRQYVDKGLYLADWGCDVVDFDGVGSE
jgi:putative transposase